MPSRSPYRTNTGIHIEWFTIRRSTLYAFALSVFGLVGAGGWAYLQIFGPKEEKPKQPIESVVDRSARFIGLDGTVKVRKAGTYEWVNADMSIRLNREDTIRTVGSSSARVRLFDGTEYLVKPDSILVIEEAFEDPDTKARRVAVKLTAGQVNLKTPRRNVDGSRSDLQTPTAAATFDERTTAEVSFNQNDNTSGFTVFRGRSDLEAGGETVTIESSQAVAVSADSNFSQVVNLPGAPTLETPANLSVLPISETVELRWRAMEGARRYRVILDQTPNFTNPILETTVKGTSVVHKGLTAGAYWWEVKALDRESREGVPSELAKFTLSSRAASNEGTPPELTVFTPSISLDGLVTVRGKTVVEAFVTVDTGNGATRVDVRGDGSFTHYFTVTETGRHKVVVRARKRDGGRPAEKTVYAQIGSD